MSARLFFEEGLCGFPVRNSSGCESACGLNRSMARLVGGDIKTSSEATSALARIDFCEAVLTECPLVSVPEYVNARSSRVLIELMVESHRETCLNSAMTKRFLTAALVAFLGLLTLQHSLVAGSRNFEETCRGNGFEILVSAKQEGEAWKVQLEPKGLSMDSSVQMLESNAPLTSVLFEDMNGDNIQELVLIFTQPGSGSYGSVRAFTTNGGKSLTEIVVDTPSGKNLEGYMGHDEYQIAENTFVRRFPVYKAGDTNANPTGGMRQFQYKLRPGEAAWHLRLDRVVSF